MATVTPEKVTARPAVAIELDRGLGVGAGEELFPEPVHDEQAVIDRNAQADQRHDVYGIGGDVGEASQEKGSGDARDDRRAPYTDGQQRRHQGAEDKQKEDDREWYRGKFGALQVVGQVGVEVTADRKSAGDVGLQPAVGLDLVANLGEVAASGSEVVLHGDECDGLLTISGGHRCHLRRRHAVNRLDVLDPGVAAQRLQGLFHRRFVGGVVHL